MNTRRIARRGGLLAFAFAVVLVMPATAHAANKWAVVSATGTLVRNNQATGVTRFGAGEYEVDFNADVTGCAYIAEPGDTGSGAVSDPAIATVARRDGNTHGVYVETWDTATNARTDEPFHIILHCDNTTNFAVVGGNGKLARGKHVSSTTHVGLGVYQVLFSINVTKCAYTSTIGTTAGGTASPGEMTVTSRGGKPAGVLVRTFNTSGAPANRSFHLAVQCGTGPTFAVINSDGSTARGPKVVSSTHLGTGQYQVIFNRTVSGCAYTATVGRAGTSTIADPVTVTTATRGGNPNGVFVFVHTYNGTVVDEPFHLRVAC